MAEQKTLSTGSSLCVLMDETGYPIHIRIIDNAPGMFEKFCRDETIFSLIHSSLESPSYMIGHVVFSDREHIPEIDKDNFNEVWRALENTPESNDRGLLSFSLHTLLGYIDKLIRNMPDEKLQEYSTLTTPRNVVPGCLCGCDLNDQNFVAEVARQNGYSEHFLAQTPKGNWMFDTTNAGKTAMIKFIQFLESNYFDPRLEIDQLTRSTVWLHKNDIPKDVNNFEPHITADCISFPETRINPDDYIRCSEITNRLQPTPESYWTNFMNYGPSPNNLIATVLSIEQKGFAPRGRLEELLCSDFPQENEGFCRIIREMMYAKGGPGILDKLKTMATRIINDTGISIRGREQEQPTSQLRTKQDEHFDDSYYPKVRAVRRH